MDDIKCSPERIPITDEFELLLSQYIARQPKDGENKFIEKRLTVSETGKSARILSHWAEEGIIDKHGNDNGWRRFSVVDVVWLSVLSKLREFGLSLPKLKNSYQSLHIDGFGNKYPQFEAGVFLASFINYPIYLVVFEDGIAQFISRNCLAVYANMNVTRRNSFLLIDFRALVSEVAPIKNELKQKFSLSELDKPLVGLNPKQLELMKQLNDPTIHKIQIQKQNGEIQLIKSTSTAPVSNADINEIAKQLGYGDLSCKVQDGVVTYSEKTKSIKL